MKQFACSVPAILSLSVASLCMIALAGCGSSGKGTLGPKAATNAYGLEYSYNETTDIEQDSVVVFSASANGSTTPTSTLMLPSNFEGYSLAVDPNGEIYVGGEQYSDDLDQGEILKYPAGASGTATPTVTLNGGGTGTFDRPDSLAVNSAGTLVVASEDGSLEAFAAGFTASSTPTQYLTWGQNNFNDPGDYLGMDTAGDIFYMDGGEEVGSGVVDVFAAGATGAAAPTRTITGTNTSYFYSLKGIAVDGAGDVYLANYNSTEDPNQPEARPGTYAANRKGQSGMARSASRLVARPHVLQAYESTEIIEFAAGAKDTPTPTKRISGTATNIVEPLQLAVDGASNLYYADANGGYDSDGSAPVLLEVFPSSASGNVAPAASITVTGFTLQNSEAVAIN